MGCSAKEIMEALSKLTVIDKFRIKVYFFTVPPALNAFVTQKYFLNGTYIYHVLISFINFAECERR